MILRKALILAALTLTTASAIAQKTNTPADSGMLKGPAIAQLEKIAQIDVPAGYIFVDGKGTRELMESKGEPTSGKEVGLLFSTNENWSVFFDYADEGYIKDDDKDKLDPKKLLASIKRGNDEANKQRVRSGNPPLQIVGWEVMPKYDSATHNLEWAIRATSGGRPLLNYNTRLLGRKGVMRVVLVVDPENLQETLPVFRNLLVGYSFNPGETYAEYRSGDKVAKYGLAALVVGGAAVGAAKLGLLGSLAIFIKKAWKVIVLGIAAIAASLKKIIGRIFGKKSGSEPFH